MFNQANGVPPPSPGPPTNRWLGERPGREEARKASLNVSWLGSGCSNAISQHTHTHTHTHTQQATHAHQHASTRCTIHTSKHARIFTLSRCSCSESESQERKRTHTHTHRCTCTHTHTHTHMHSASPLAARLFHSAGL